MPLDGRGVGPPWQHCAAHSRVCVDWLDGGGGGSRGPIRVRYCSRALSHTPIGDQVLGQSSEIVCGPISIYPIVSWLFLNFPRTATLPRSSARTPDRYRKRVATRGIDANGPVARRARLSITVRVVRRPITVRFGVQPITHHPFRTRDRIFLTWTSK